MAENIDIESKLCSFVEGDLDAASRAEIERYLQANPQYRAVLDELIRARGELRALPRVRAPMDVQENISGQLERSALLGTEDPLSTGGGIKRFPYFRAWAAIIVLGLALAAVIYSVLPARQAQLSELQALTTRPVENEVAASSPSTLPDRSTDAPLNSTVLAMAAPAATEPLALTTASTEAVAKSELADAAAGRNLETFAAQALVIPSTNLPAAETRVHDYLRSQHFSYATSITTVADGTAGAAAGAAINSPTLRQGALGSLGTSGNPSIIAPEVRMITVRQLTTPQLQQTRLALANIDQDNAVNAYVSPIAHASPFTPTTESNWQKSTATTDPLQSDLDLVPGERIHISAQDNGLNVAAMDEVMMVDSAGDITLPLVGKVRAAGLTPSELSQSIALQYEIARSPTRATWTIHREATTRPLATVAALASTLDMHAAAATRSVPIGVPSADSRQPLPSTQPAAAQQIAQLSTLQSGEGGLTVAKSIDQRPAAARKSSQMIATSLPTTSLPIASPPTTSASAIQSAASTTEPSEPRSDLMIMLIQTTTSSSPAKSATAATMPASAPTNLRTTTAP